MRFILPELPYSYDALEPYFDKKTMILHHTKHHQNYVNNTNAILDSINYQANSIEQLISSLHAVPLDEKKLISLRNNAGGHANHNFFWNCLKPKTKLTGVLKNKIETQFNNINHFKDIFEQTAVNHFGSGWVWLLHNEGKLNITSTINQDNPLMEKNTKNFKGYPILCLDLWEHAYYLNYFNNKLDYIKSFWNIVDWNEATNRI
ncbi:Fe-Mn family superoxide dismutase [Buchnera aphidicola]|uniref:Superoxide dismutase n=1 Tax=Buchnera aphidicola (Anoecia oenotherae) TaxID=1241833 RepID=A0A4D6XR93_9GAMM|nr:Fe-Mn family superoxide dismutase [Buchnera aphidicola]QCI19286.1 superoxide dismutase [Mn] [Buchnera aphidicola (Anoecia oenotherae)]